MVSESLVEPGPGITAELPPDRVPQRAFDAANIRQGLPAPGPFGRLDLRCCAMRAAR